MKTNLKKLIIFTLYLLFPFHSLLAIDPVNTRLLTQPTLSGDQIAFIYASDLWVAQKDGSNPRRLTAEQGEVSNPVFSPDGKMIAFNAWYDGNVDVFVVPSTGGIPKRLTWHPYPDLVRGFTPDGKSVLFASQRDVFTNRYFKLYTVDIESGKESALPLPNAFWASFSADGKYLAYTPIADRFLQWKHYRGGTTSRIWIFNMEDHSVSEIPKPETGSNDTQPLWVAGKVYFRSDRDGELNLYSFDPGSNVIQKLTDYQDFHVANLGASSSEIIFEQAGYLHILKPNQNTSTQLKIGISTDLLEHRPRFVSGSKYVRSAHISPSGARIVVDFRGEIITVPAKKGDPLNLSQTPGAHEKYPAWSPDGKKVAYLSDALGEYALHIQNQDGQGEVQRIELKGSGFYAHLHWSPDSKKICLVDNGRNLFLVDLAIGTTTKIASDAVYFPGIFRDLFGSWSADATWVAYTVITPTNFERAYVYSVNENKSYPISDGLSNVTNPIFDPSGKYLYLLASTDAGPVVNWFDQSNQDMSLSNTIYLVTLQKEVPSPLVKENDVETAEKKDEGKKDEEKNGEIKSVKIDFEGLENRILNVPIPSGIYSQLQVPKEGKIYYISHPRGKGDNMLHHYDLDKRKEEPIMPADNFVLTSKGDKMLFQSKGKWSIAETGKKPESDALINLDQVEVKIEPLQEWPNIFQEAWRVNRDYFYDPGMHGADWDAMKKKYEVFLPDLSTKSDLYRVMGWMFSELAVGHHGFNSRGDALHEPKTVKGGLLGADYEIANGRYRIKKIYGGLNWTPELRSPLTEPGISVKEGDYILEVNGKPVKASDNFFSFFENTADKLTVLTVSSKPEMGGSRKVTVTPLASEMALRNRDWVEGNMKKVHAATDGRVAYIYVPNTTSLGHEYFKRYFFPQADKDAIIIDERFNGGGQLADYYIDILKKPVQSYWNYRYGQDQKAPNASIQGPKVMLIDETAGSGGDYLPYLFRQAGLGTLIGKTTWGGLVGVLGFPEFIDGGIVTAPNLAFYDERGFVIENEGVAPDIEVEQWPAEVIQGKDPQLEKAIEVILEQLRKSPPQKMKTPSYPKRVK